MPTATLPSPINLPPERQQSLERLVQMVREVSGERALALLAIGPGLSNERSHHPMDSVLVLSSDDLAPLLHVAEKGIKLGRQGIAAPLVMTPETIEHSRDTFPLEYIDIAQRHVLLFGSDHFTSLRFTPEHVRLQCERDLRAVALAMRQRVLRLGKPKQFHPHDLSETIVRVLRGLIHLRECPPQVHGPEVIAAAERLCGRQLPAVRSTWQGQDGWDTFAQLYEEVRILGNLVDGW